jgi:Zn-dependent protease
MMSSETRKSCLRCSAPLEADALACPGCHALVYREELERLSGEANALEKKGDWRQARERWLAALEMLPPTSTQAQWVRNHAFDLERSAAEAETPKPETKLDQLIKKLGPLASLGVLFAKLKPVMAFLKFNFVFSLAAFMVFYMKAFGAEFGIGIAMLVLAHEMGHYVEVKRRGLHADLPIFLPGLGAYVKWKAQGVPPEVCAAVSLAGPVAGACSAIVCALLWWKTGGKLWAALAHTAAWFNAFNLMPIAILDGAGVFPVLGALGQVVVVTTGLALWQFTGEGVFLLVTAAATWFTLVTPESRTANRRLTAGFAAVLTVLAVVIWLIPKHTNFK